MKQRALHDPIQERDDGPLAYEPVMWKLECGKYVTCGGSCVLAENHQGKCECGADVPGNPGTCPAN